MRHFQEIKVVCLGGGTGLSTLLSGLKHISLDAPLRIDGHLFALKNTTAVVTVSDDGGSSGRLRDQFQTPAPGDIRNCLVALASDESLMTQLFRYRFSGQGELHDHSLGNLLLTALTDITGDFMQAIKLSSQVLAIEGRILPSTSQNVRLRAVLEDGTEVSGETNISKAKCRIKRVLLEPMACCPLPEAIEAIEQADIVTVGPGSLFTSLIPNLVVAGVAETIRRSKAVKVYVANLMTQPGETDGMTLSDHFDALTDHTGRPPLFGHVLVNSAPISEAMLARYREEGAEPVTDDQDRLENLGLKVHRAPLAHEGQMVRHNPVPLAQAILEILDKERSQ